MLRSITLTNWRSHGTTRVRLTRGANLLLGPMGSGKSSLMDALCFALYGTYPKLGRREVKMEEVANFRHAGQTVAVEVEWDDADGAGKSIHNYKVRRELASGSAWLYADGKLLQKGPRAVSEETERLLAISYELFSRAVYSEQNKLDAWLTLAPGARKAELDRLLGLDRFELARANAASAYNKTKERAAQAEAQAPAQKLEGERKNLAALMMQLEKRQKEREERKTEAQRLENELAAVQKEWERMELARKRKEELMQKLQKAMGTILAGERMLASLPVLAKSEEVEKELARAGEDRKSVERQIRELNAKANEESQKAGKLGEQIRGEKSRVLKLADVMEKQKALLLPYASLESLRTTLASAQNGLSIHQQEAAVLQAEQKDRQKVLQTIEVGAHKPAAGADAKASDASPSSSLCPVCGTPLENHKREQLKTDMEKRLLELAARISQNAELLHKDRKEVEHLSKQDADAGRLEAQRTALGEAQDAAWLQKQLEACLTQSQILGAKGKELSARLQMLAGAESKALQARAQIRQTEEWKTQLKTAREQQAALEVEMRGNAFDESAHGTLAKKREELMALRARTQEELRNLGQLVDADMQMVKMQQQLAAQLEKMKKEADEARKEMDELASFRTVLSSTQSGLRARLLGDINMALARLWPLIYPYGDWENVRLTAGEKDYSVEIYQNEWKSLEAHASGGERACLGLALRVALSVLLTPQLGWLILDEPTHNLDAKAVQTLGTALAERIPQIVPQVIVITHENQLVESTPGRIIRFSRDKLKGEDTRVEVEGEGEEKG